MNPALFTQPLAGRVIRHTKGYWAFIPADLPPALEWSEALAGVNAEAERNLGKLAGLAEILPTPHLLTRSFVRHEAVVSSRIEGTRASLSDLYAYESAQLSFLEADADVREVYNYVVAMNYGLERLASLPISLRLIREIHAKLMEGVRGELLTPGEFRRSQNWIGPAGSTIENAPYVPPPVDEMLTALYQMEKFIQTGSEIPPLVRTGMIHYQFEAIHPFLDGNGRVGRLLVILLLCAWDLLPQPVLFLSGYFDANRQEYYHRLMKVSQKGDWEGWLTFYLNGISIQSQETAARILRIQALRDQYRQRLQSQRGAGRLLQALDILFERPILTVRQMQAELQSQYPMAQRIIDRLIAEGIVREVTGRARNRLYRADEILLALEGL